MAFMFKYYFALIIFMPVFFMCQDLFAYPARFLIIIPLALWGVFALTATEVWVCEGVLKYRRFLFWRQIF